MVIYLVYELVRHIDLLFEKLLINEQVVILSDKFILLLFFHSRRGGGVVVLFFHEKDCVDPIIDLQNVKFTTFLKMAVENLKKYSD